MLNPDRAESEFIQPASVPENPKKNGHIPHWAKIPAFAIRTSLAILVTTPGMMIATDVINRTDNSTIVSDYGQSITVNPQVDLEPTPTPSQSPEVYKLHLRSHLSVFRGFLDESDLKQLDVSSRFIDGGGGTHITLKAGQTLEISATGRVYFQDPWYEERYSRSCEESNIFDPDGNRYWHNTICPPDQARETDIKGARMGMLMGNIGRSEPQILIGSHWRGSAARDGMLYFWIINRGFLTYSGGFNITVTVYPIEPTPTSTPQPSRPAFTFTPEPTRTTVSTKPSFDQSTLLWGLGAVVFTGLAYKVYERWKPLRKTTSTGTTIGSVGGTISSTASTSKIRGIAELIAPSSSPNTAPNFGPTQQKNPEWIIGQQEFENKWQSVKTKLLPIQPGETGNEPEHILDRFKAGMNIVHEVSLSNTIRVPRMAIRIRAGIEYLIPEIWPDNGIFRRFFDPNFNVGYLNAEDLARIIYLPEKQRNLSSFSSDQKRDIRRIHRILVYALHPDTAKVDADKSLQDSINDLLKKFNPAWSYIDNLIKL